MLSLTAKKKVPILMYHSISHNTTAKFKQFTVSPEMFAEQMAYLHQHSYSPITVTQFVRALYQGESVLPERPVVLTFDDGFADFFSEAFPILRKYSFVATLYVVTAFVNDTSRWLEREGEAARLVLTWNQLSEICASGIECGAHSHRHRQLDTLPNAESHYEIAHCKELLEHYLGQDILSFAYPFGYHNATLRQLVREAGYTSACAVKYTMSTEATNPFALARLMVKANTSIDALATMLTGSGSSSVTIKYLRGRTAVWQFARHSSASLMRLTQHCSASAMQYLQERLPVR